MNCLTSCPGSLRRRNPKWRPVWSGCHCRFQTLKDTGVFKLPPVLPLYPCMFRTVPLRVPCVLYPSHLSFAPLCVPFELFCTNFLRFLSLLYFFPSLLYSLPSHHTFSLGLIRFSPNRLTIISRLFCTFILSVIYFLPQYFSRFPIKYTKLKDIKKHP